MDNLLQIKDLSVNIENKQVLTGVSLNINAGETHVLMGPNGAGKSTLGYTIMGNPRYTVSGTGKAALFVLLLLEERFV